MSHNHAHLVHTHRRPYGRMERARSCADKARRATARHDERQSPFIEVSIHRRDDDPALPDSDIMITVQHHGHHQGQVPAQATAGGGS